MTGTWTSLALLGALGLSGPAPAAQESDSEQLFAGALARVHELDAFRAEYTFERTDQPPGRLELVYRAPDEALIGVTSEDGSMRSWLIGEEMHLRRFEGGKMVAWGSFDTAKLLVDEVWEIFAEEFPRERERLPSGAVFHMHLELDPDQPARFDFNLAIESGRRSVLCWGQLEDRLPVPTLRDGEFLFGEGETFLSVSEATGFLASARGKSQAGLRVTLESLQTEGGVSDEDFVVPDPVEGARDISGEMAAGLRNGLLGPRQRTRVFAALAHQIETERVTWGAEVRTKLANVLHAFHQRSVSNRYASWIGRTEEQIGRIGEKVRAGYDEGADPEEIEVEVARARSELATSTDSLRRAYQSALASAEVQVEGDRGWIAEGLEVEAEVVAAVFDESLAGPLLAFFDETIEASSQQ